MTKEFKLSDRIFKWGTFKNSAIPTYEVKEFIRLRDEIDDKLFKGEIEWGKHMVEKNKLTGDLK